MVDPREVVQANRNFRVDRPVMDRHNADLFNLKELKRAEDDELDRAIVEYWYHGGEQLKKAMASEMADVLLFLLTMADTAGIDLFYETMEKVARNMCKRPAYLFSNGLSYDQANEIAISEWKTQGGDEEFYR